MQPEHGGRFRLALSHSDDDQARYEASLDTRDGSWSGQLLVAVADGEVAWEPRPGAAPVPGWLLGYARSALRLAWRQRDAEGWPHRLTRWRAAPEPSTPADGSG